MGLFLILHKKLNGKIQDIFVENGFIIIPSSAEKYNIVYDVKGMIVMAGGIDIHSHIAGGNVNNARLLSPEIHSNFLENNLKRKNLYLDLILDGHQKVLAIDMQKWVLQQLLNQQ